MAWKDYNNQLSAQIINMFNGEPICAPILLNEQGYRELLALTNSNELINKRTIESFFQPKADVTLDQDMIKTVTEVSQNKFALSTYSHNGSVLEDQTIFIYPNEPGTIQTFDTLSLAGGGPAVIWEDLGWYSVLGDEQLYLQLFDENGDLYGGRLAISDGKLFSRTDQFRQWNTTFN